MILLPVDFWEMQKTGKRGKGIFATRDIPAGRIIGDYIGRIIKIAEEDVYDNGDHFYLMYYHDYASIFPNLKKPGVHLINHSCTPNVWMYTYKGHTLYFAIRHIFPGEELTVSYLLSPQDNDCKPCTHLCHCGAVICHHTMHLSQEEYNEWISFHDKEAKKTKRVRVTYGKTLPLLTSYPENIEDNPIYTLFGSMHVPPKRLNLEALPEMTEIRKMLRETGRTLEFSKLHLLVYGIKNNLLISKRSKPQLKSHLTLSRKRAYDKGDEE